MLAIKNILVATDFGTCSEKAMAYGCDLARTFDATLHVIHVVDDVFGRHLGTRGYSSDPSRIQHELESSAQKRLDGLLKDQSACLKMKAEMRISNAPAMEIVDYARDAGIDLIVVGTHGRSAVAHVLLGSVAEKVARTAPCPVLTVRAPDRELVESDPLLVLASA
jgi:nucleotide-binding universal stress UspA family protein